MPLRACRGLRRSSFLGLLRRAPAQPNNCLVNRLFFACRPTPRQYSIKCQQVEYARRFVCRNPYSDRTSNELTHVIRSVFIRSRTIQNPATKQPNLDRPSKPHAFKRIAVDNTHDRRASRNAVAVGFSRDSHWHQRKKPRQQPHCKLGCGLGFSMHAVFGYVVSSRPKVGFRSDCT